jgi:hypothetical protein
VSTSIARNAERTTALSVHVYGAGISALSSGNNECFDALPVLPGGSSGRAAAWRTVRDWR